MGLVITSCMPASRNNAARRQSRGNHDQVRSSIRVSSSLWEIIICFGATSSLITCRQKREVDIKTYQRSSQEIRHYPHKIVIIQRIRRYHKISDMIKSAIIKTNQIRRYKRLETIIFPQNESRYEASLLHVPKN